MSTAAPAAYNIRPQRRADFQLQLAFKDSDGVAISLEDRTIVAQVWDAKRTTKLGDFVVDITNGPGGEATLTLPYTATADLPAEARYDVMVIDDSSGLRSYYLEGIVRPSEGYSEPEA